MCQECPKDRGIWESVDVATLRETFRDKKAVPYPQNFVDIPSPLPADLLPDFLQGPNCSLLTDIKRLILNSIEDSPAPVELATLANELHKRDTLQRHWRTHEKAITLATPGALTLPHYDTFGYATWISCQQGRIGLAWLSNPSENDLEAWRRNDDGYHSNGKWLFNVLRSCDTVYLPPGTVHFVFRLPEGNPTMAASGHLLRRLDTVRWLQVLMMQVQDAHEVLDKTSLTDIAPQLIEAARLLLPDFEGMDDSESEDELGRPAARYGGSDKVEESAKLIHDIEEELSKLLRVEEALPIGTALNDHDHDDRVRNGDAEQRSDDANHGRGRGGRSDDNGNNDTGDADDADDDNDGLSRRMHGRKMTRAAAAEGSSGSASNWQNKTHDILHEAASDNAGKQANIAGASTAKPEPASSSQGTRPRRQRQSPPIDDPQDTSYGPQQQGSRSRKSSGKATEKVADVDDGWVDEEEGLAPRDHDTVKPAAPQVKTKAKKAKEPVATGRKKKGTAEVIKPKPTKPQH